MSGLFGYFGKRRALPTLLQGIKLMQEHKYDSCGCIMKGSRGFYVKKRLGSVRELEKELIGYSGEESVGVVHLRWATHGSVEEKNIHPFFDCNGKIAIMHKGIVENHKDIRKNLIDEGHVFKSNTDSEVIVHLIEKYYEGDLHQALRKTLMVIRGTYALVVFYNDEKSEILIANSGMGLALGVGQGEYWFTTDTNLVQPFTDKVVFLNDGEMMILNEEGFVGSMVTGGDINVVSKVVEQIDASNDVDFQLQNVEKEIYEHPEMIENTLAGRIDRQQLTAHFGGLIERKDFFRNVDELTFVGSGSSYFAAKMAKKMIEDYLAVKVNCYSGLEMRNKKFLMTSGNSVVFAISQSGETEDTIAAVREAKLLGLRVYGITNSVGSQLAKETTSGIYLHSGPVLGSPSMRSFMSQLVAIVMLTLFLGRLKGLSPASGKDIIRSLDQLPFNLKNIMSNAFSYETIAKKYRYANDFVLVGFKYCHVIGEEMSLFMQNISGMEAANIGLNFLKYGGKNHLNERHVVLYMLPLDSVYEDNVEMIKQLHGKNVKVIVFTQEGAQGLDGIADDVILLPKTKEIVMPLTMLMALQLFILNIHKEKNQNGKGFGLEDIHESGVYDDFGY